MGAVYLGELRGHGGLPQQMRLQGSPVHPRGWELIERWTNVRRMRPIWSGHMRGAMGRPRVGPLVVPTSGEEWIGPTEDDVEMERKAAEGWVWEGEAKGDG